MSLREQVAARLAVVRYSLRRHFLAEGLARMLVATVGLLLLSLGLDWWLDLSWNARLIYWMVVLSVASGLLYWFVIRPWKLPLGPIDVAAVLDQKRGGAPLASQVASVMQLAEASPDQFGESAAMREQAVRASHAALEQVDFTATLNPRHFWTAIAVAVGALMLPTGIALAFPSTARLWAERWFSGSDRPWPRSTRIVVEGVRNGVLQVPRGEAVALQVRVIDDEAPTEAVWLRQRPAEGKTQTLTLEKFADGDFRLQLAPQQQVSRMEVWGGDGRAEPFRVEPVDRPRITQIQLTARTPRDKTPQNYDFSATEGGVRLPPQTQVSLHFETNIECETVKVESTSATVPAFRRQSTLAHAVEWTHQESVSLRVVLVSSESGLESHPQSINIGELPDRAPRMSVRHSGVRLRVTPSATIPFTISARDDFGIAQVNLKQELAAISSKVSAPEEAAAPSPPSPAIGPEDTTATPPSSAVDSEAPPVSGSESTDPAAALPEVKESAPEAAPPIASPAAPRVATLFPPPVEGGGSQIPRQLVVDLEHRVEVADWKLEPGRTLVIFATATDDCVLGAQSTNSAPVIFKIVSDKELFKEILLRQQQLRVRLRKARDQADDMASKLKFAVTAEDARAIARQHQVVTREVGQVSQGLEATRLEMELNKLGGEEANQLIEEIVLKPLRNLAESDLPGQRQNLESLVESPGERLDEILAVQQKIVADLDKILKNMSQWDSFIDIVNQFDEVIKLETRVRDRTEELKKSAGEQRKKETDSIFDN
ncbi:MAG: hypothetical protein DWH91_18505 [Planctomycetota bacterium]|nr:MAG: hypothetical protein DWH91_18505 [Planctomycetota bacterium]